MEIDVHLVGNITEFYETLTKNLPLFPFLVVGGRMRKQAPAANPEGPL